MLLSVFLAEGFTKIYSGIAFDCTSEDVANGVEDDVGLIFVVVAYELGFVLSSYYNGNSVLAAGVDKIVKSLEIDGWEFVDKNAAFLFPRNVDEFEELGCEQRKCGAVYALAFGIIAYADDFRLLGVVDVEGEVIA